MSTHCTHMGIIRTKKIGNQIDFEHCFYIGAQMKTMFLLDVTSFLVELIPSWMGHTVGTIGLAIANFYVVPSSQ